MRIVQLIPNLECGGGQRLLIYLCDQMVRMGCQVDVAMVSGGPYLELLRQTGTRTHLLPKSGNHDPRILWGICRLLQQTRAQVVHTWLRQMDVLGGLASRLCHLPWVISEVSSARNFPPHWKHWLRARLGASADAVVANSKGGREYWRQNVSRTDRLHVIPNAVPVRVIQSAPPIEAEVSQVADDQKLILHVGRLDWEKNLDNLLQALVRAVQSDRRAKAVLCGDGPLRKQVQERLAHLAPDGSIRLHGYTSDIWRWMRRADVMVSASWFEGSSNAVLEAMAAGCPMVLSDIPGHREAVGPDQVLLAPPDQPEQLAQGILETLQYPQAARERARRASLAVQQYQPELIASRFLSLYEDILTRRRKTSGLAS